MDITHVNLRDRRVDALRNFSRLDIHLAGGKGANLGELIRVGFTVPDGFVVTTLGYDDFIGQNNLAPVIARYLAAPQSNSTSLLDAFDQSAFPPGLAQVILAAYSRLGRGPVAVRSSATAEDLPEAAFAGQQDTYLNVIGPEALLQAIKSCWASLWNSRAVAYRQRQGVENAGVKLAVVVQCMLPAAVAGVMFTANPITGDRQQVIVDGSPGLGEAVVSGKVTPDHFILIHRRFGWHITERVLGKREVIVRPRPEGGTEQIAVPDPGNLPLLPDRALYRLASLGASIQRHFGSPQDVEWAYAGGKLFILQARPMTALPEPPARLSIIQRMVANNFVEMLPERPYPLDLDTWLPALDSAVNPIFAMLGLDWKLHWLFEEEDGVILRYCARLPRPTWKVLLAPARLAWLGLRYNPLKWQSDALIPKVLERARQLQSRDLRTLSWDELPTLVLAVQQISAQVGGEIRQHYFPRAAFAALRLRLLLAILGQSSSFGTLFTGVENKTLEMNRALESLAQRVRSTPDLLILFSSHPAAEIYADLDNISSGREFKVAFHRFLDQYGHRETLISSTLEPTWKDAPGLALGIVKTYAMSPTPPPTAPPAWQAARDSVLRHPLLRFAPLRDLFEHLLAESRLLLQVREDTHFYATLPMPIFHSMFLEFGRRLVAAGLLETPADVYHLRLAELEQAGRLLPPASSTGGGLQAMIERRKQLRLSLAGTPLIRVPRPAPLPRDAGALLVGMAGSPGVADGPVRLVRDNSEFGKLMPGDVLVAPYTNPSWTPLFQRAVAVVVDTGSLASHAAIVAREYGIPAVMGTVVGTQAFHDGDWVRVDGTHGTVQAAEPRQQQLKSQEARL